MDPVAAALFAVAACVGGIVAQGCVDYQLAKRYTVPRTVELARVETQKIVAEELAKLKPGAMRGDLDPRDMADRRWILAEEKKIRLAATEAKILAAVTPRLGTKAVTWWNLLPETTRAGALAAGEQWMNVLGPFLSLMPPAAADNDATREHAPRAEMITQ